MDIRLIKAIDSHTHINHKSPFDSNQTEVYSAYLEDLVRINQAANINTMMCSTFASVLNASVIVKENDYMAELCNQFDFLYQWVVIHPSIEETFKQASKMLKSKKCVGIKLHPVYHKYSLKENADKIFSFASEYNAIVQIHPDCSPIEYVSVADKYPDVKFIMAHMCDFRYADAIEQAKYENIYTDTSGSASTQNNVIEYAVNRIGSEHILFGTDTYSAGFQRGRIEYALISEHDKINILRDNAKRLFGM